MTGPHDLSYGRADDIHLSRRKSVPASKIARGAAWPNIVPSVRSRVVNSVKPAREFYGSAVCARAGNQRQDLRSRHVAFVNPAVGFTQKNGSPLVRFVVPPLALNSFCPLVRRVVRPPVRSVVSPSFTLSVAGPALVSQPKRARNVAQENRRVRPKKLIATIAITEPGRCGYKALSHGKTMKEIATFGKTGRIFSFLGPHIRLSEYCMDEIVKIAKDWTILAAFFSLVSGAIGVAAFWAWRQYHVLKAILSEFKPNGGSSLRDAINKIQSTVVIVDARQWAIVAGLRDPMWESDAHGGCVRANRALLDLVQRNFDEMAGTGWENIICPDDKPRVWQEWTSAVERKRTFESVYCVTDRAGERFRVQAIAIPFRSPTGDVVGYVGRYSQVEQMPKMAI